MRHTVTVLLALTSLVAVRVSAAAGDACGPGLKLCGSDAPCCSEVSSSSFGDGIPIIWLDSGWTGNGKLP